MIFQKSITQTNNKSFKLYVQGHLNLKKTQTTHETSSFSHKKDPFFLQKEPEKQKKSTSLQHKQKKNTTTSSEKKKKSTTYLPLTYPPPPEIRVLEPALLRETQWVFTRPGFIRPATYVAAPGRSQAILFPSMFRFGCFQK